MMIHYSISVIVFNLMGTRLGSEPPHCQDNPVIWSGIFQEERILVFGTGNALVFGPGSKSCYFPHSRCTSFMADAVIKLTGMAEDTPL